MRRRMLMSSAVTEGIPVEDATVCDVVFYNPTLKDLVIRRDQKDWKTNEEPIGIVVIPTSHNVYGNGACGVMALMAASCNTPDVGSTSNERIYWAQYGTDISELYNYTGVVYSKDDGNDTGTAQGIFTFGTYLPSDKFSASQCSTDPLAYYNWDDNSRYAPSPYLNDGSRNPAYYQTSAPSSIDNVLSDFKGKENTDILLSHATKQPDWKTALSIEHKDSSGYSPAACACWRYSTTGTKQGDWYWPASGELGYACVRFQKINNTISTLESYFGKTFCLLSTDYYWASSEALSNYAWYLSFNNGSVTKEIKYYTYYIRPFMQLKPKLEKFVDMGLSVDWATCNIGAESPEEYGYFFQWGGTIAYNSDCTPVEGGFTVNFNFNSNCPYWVNGTNYSSKWSKYTTANSYSSTGVADNKLTLDPEDDAANVHLGGDWRMPTYEEYNELLNACNTTWVTDYNGTGINGRLFTLKADSSKTLFFPAAGYLYSSGWYFAGLYGFNWSSSLNRSTSFNSWNLHFASDFCYTPGYDRYYGLPVRAVKPK